MHCSGKMCGVLRAQWLHADGNAQVKVHLRFCGECHSRAGSCRRGQGSYARSQSCTRSHASEFPYSGSLSFGASAKDTADDSSYDRAAFHLCLSGFRLAGSLYVELI